MYFLFLFYFNSKCVMTWLKNCVRISYSTVAFFAETKCIAYIVHATKNEGKDEEESARKLTTGSENASM